MNINKKLIEWYNSNKRDLPWRKTNDPYKIWLSEIILQQTRVNQGLPYYEKFINEFNDVFSLAAAPKDKVLRLWQGLGYYTRAHNLHNTAKVIADKYNGKFPDNYKELLYLKGIGKYTAAAIASFSFNENVAVLDGNVARVITRIYGIKEDISYKKGKNLIENKIYDLLPTNNSAVFNQAIMEFGATFCIPVNPTCESCIFKYICYAFRHNLQHELPVKKKKAKVKSRFFNYMVFKTDNQLYMKKRNNNDIWKGLFDFYLIEKEKETDTYTIIKEISNEFDLEIGANYIKDTVFFNHQLTHQKIHAKFIIVEVYDNVLNNKIKSINGIFKYAENQILNLPKPILINKFLNNYYFS